MFIPCNYSDIVIYDIVNLFSGIQNRFEIKRDARRRFDLSGRELMLLKVLIREPVRVFTRTELCERVREQEHEYDTKLVEVFIARLRKKIGDPPLIHTVRYVGYTVREGK